MSQSELDTLVRDRDFQAAASGNLHPPAPAVPRPQPQDHIVIDMEAIEAPVFSH